MLRKLAKAHENWFLKVILTFVVISFISLFGVTGYINSASQNQVVVNVDGIKTTQSEFSYQINKELNAVKNIAGEDFELTDEMRNSIAENTLKQIVNEGILDSAMDRYDIRFPRSFVQQVLFNQPEFKNPATNYFSPELFKRYLSITGMTEDEYVANIKRMLAKKILIDDLLGSVEVPSVLSNAMHKMDNQRKIFKYVQISPKNITIDRAISDDEFNQYFADFGEKFAIPETRSIEVLFINNKVIEDKYVADEQTVRDYFEQNKDLLNQPEKREVLQMVFLDKESAEKALNDVVSGKDFDKVAKELNAENANSPTLGVVAYDELADGLADETFGLALNTPKLVEVADTWQVISVKEIKPAKEAVFEDVRAQIVAQLVEENMYDAYREVKGIIDDAINSGKSLAEIGNDFGVSPLTISNIREEEIISDAPDILGNAISSLDFNEYVFSYGLDEYSSAEETDNGIVVFKVTDIIDEHIPEINDIKDEIINLWQIQERNALAKEIAENLILEIEEGSDIATVAKARGLEVFRSEPISRNDTFANLYYNDISDLFLLDTNQAKLIEKEANHFVIAQLIETIHFNDELNNETLSAINERALISLLSDMSNLALKSYGDDLSIVVDYKKAGFSE